MLPKDISRESGLLRIADAGRATELAEEELTEEEPEVAEYIDGGGAEDVLVRGGIDGPGTGVELSLV